LLRYLCPRFPSSSVYHPNDRVFDKEKSISSALEKELKRSPTLSHLAFGIWHLSRPMFEY